MKLAAHVVVHLGTLTLDASVDADDGETVAILGPNGAGKSTLLRALAGLLPIDAGRIELDGVILDDGDRAFVPAERRPIGMVFQDHLLFPHLSVLDNVAFGLRSRGRSKATARAIAAEVLGHAGIGALETARPSALSGGQAQRVALERALVTEPLLLLLDEPLAALDPQARGAVRRALRSRLAAFPGVRLLVTHDPLDAAVLADRLVILEAGRVTQTGTFAEVSARPRTAYAADLVGVNRLQGVLDDDGLRLPSGAVLVVPHDAPGPAGAVIHPRAVALHRERPTGSPRNVVPGTVASIEEFDNRVRVRLDGPIPLVAEITPAARDELGLEDGAAVWAAVKATEVTILPE